MIYKNIEEFLIHYERDNVTFTIANFAMLDMVVNLVDSANRAGVHLVLVALDKQIAVALMDKCTVVMYDLNIISDKFYVYGTQEYWDLTWFRWAIWGDILASGRTYIHLDADIVILRNFETDTLKLLEPHDCVIQHEGKPSNPNGCPGFHAVKPGPASEVFTMDFLRKNNFRKYTKGDEPFFNKVVMNVLDVALLPLDTYPHYRHYRDFHPQLNPYIVHFNFMIGYKKKISKMIEYKLWNG